ncbi:MAG: beta-ketoacyl-[acyl-carrier-protein] synthase family protein [Flavobacteriales bacterium]|nr:beta-ketoacyl-[acyl-carrier-protein] synthase family protein [Flavobacteriales bacterium]
MKGPAIAITGAGAVCAIGTGAAAIAHSLSEGRSGIVPRQMKDFPVLHFGAVELSNEELAERLGLNTRAPRSRTSLLALMAAREALGPGMHTDTAVISASTVGGMDITEDLFDGWRQTRMEQARLAREHAVSAHTDAIAEAIGSQAFRSTISTACSSSANAIALGARLLQQGRARRVLAGGSDALCRFTVAGFRALSAMDPLPTRPFSPDRKGMNLGEGAAYLVLERLDDALRKGHEPLGLLAGWSNRNDAHHATATSPEGHGPFLAMQEAIARAGLVPADIDHINAHGTGTDNNDDTELRAMERLFGTVPPFTSTKALTGHTLAAAGSLEAVIALQCLRIGLVPAASSAMEPMAGHACMPVAAPLRKKIRNVLSCSFGFGGNCSAIVITQPV